MFFGSGNLVFPIQIGQATGGDWLLGFCGLFITGVLLPLLGLFVIKLHRGSYTAFFAEAGWLAKVILPLFTLSLLGSFGVVPRCITVAHGGINYLLPQIHLVTFSIIFCIITFLFCLKDKLMLKILGKWMSPILLISLTILIVIGIINIPEHNSSMPILQSSTAFIKGFLIGYQTMDLFAAFFFSALTFAQIQQIMPENTSNKDTIKFAIQSSILGAVLLALVYLGFVFLGAHYATLISKVTPELMLPSIAQHTMGDNATIFIGTVMLFSCLTTAVALNNIYARYLCTLLHISTKKFPFVLFATTAIACIISLLDFKGIAAFLAPMLEISYPGVIALTILSIITRKWLKLKIFIFYSISIIMLTLTFL
jgi:LIVCS family branched-chain amino acid:cation transporter